mgnify:CR=1 FL=1
MWKIGEFKSRRKVEEFAKISGKREKHTDEVINNSSFSESQLIQGLSDGGCIS